MTRILVVEQSREIAQFVREILSLGNYQVELAANGQECLDVVSSFSPDLILLSVTMPDMNGWKVLMRLTEIPFLKRTQVLMFTTCPNVETTLKKMKLGRRVGHIPKPFTVKELLKGVRTAVEAC